MTNKRIGVCCIYCNYKERQTATSLLSSLIQQLLQQLSTIPEHIKSVYENHSERRTRPGRVECGDILHHLLGSFSQTFLVVDALDEYGEVTTREFIKSIIALPLVHILIFSRDVPYVERHLSSCPRLDVYASADDIRNYVEAGMQDGAELADFVEEDKALHDKILATVVQRSCGMPVKIFRFPVAETC